MLRQISFRCKNPFCQTSFQRLRDFFEALSNDDQNRSQKVLYVNNIFCKNSYRSKFFRVTSLSNSIHESICFKLAGPDFSHPVAMVTGTSHGHYSDWSTRTGSGFITQMVPKLRRTEIKRRKQILVRHISVIFSGPQVG